MPAADPPAIVVLISGRGSNLRAIVDAALPCRIAAVISNRPAAAGLGFAQSRGIPTAVVDHAGFATREAFDEALVRAIDAHAPVLVVLAGFMRILSPAFVEHYAQRLINIHPSLLPSFPGLHTHRRALDEGVRIHGCTVHLVTSALDSGPIIAQAAVPVHADDTEASLSARVLTQEHRLYPQVVRWFVERRLEISGEQARMNTGGVERPLQVGSLALVSPPLD